jgi:hypothetical protein
MSLINSGDYLVQNNDKCDEWKNYFHKLGSEAVLMRDAFNFINGQKPDSRNEELLKILGHIGDTVPVTPKTSNEELLKTLENINKNIENVYIELGKIDGDKKVCRAVMINDNPIFEKTSAIKMDHVSNKMTLLNDDIKALVVSVRLLIGMVVGIGVVVIGRLVGVL